MNDHRKHLLPEHITPERYEIIMRPDFKTEAFAGSETIFLYIKKSANQIILHARDLKIFNVEFCTTSAANGRRNDGKMEAGGFRYNASKIIFNKKDETAIIKFNKKLPKGAGQLKLRFKGALSGSMRGFYKSRYTHNGREKILATTQFEATDARQAFPCFDEPAQKAVFDVTLIIPGHMTAVSNTIEQAVSEHEAGYKAVKFAPTPKMSTYLLAFIIGELEYIEAKTNRGVVVRVFTTPGKKHQSLFALNTAVKCLEFYEKYFSIPYPLPVLDLIAIPDFESAAMENWGAITYRETALLVDPKQTSAANKQWTAIVIAHEIAHMWFGNLVTMRWWTDLWLNEGFAEYMEYVAVNAIFPKWNIWNHFISGRFDAGLSLDALRHTHPVQVEIFHPDEISENFDMVSYAKGAACIRMLAEFLGPVNFRRGISHYLKKHAFGNAVTKDLWKALGEVSGKNVAAFMDAWVGRPGYPVVSVSTNNNNKNNHNILQLKQERFFTNPNSAKKMSGKTVWPIPIKLKNVKNSEQAVDILLNKKAAGRSLKKNNNTDAEFKLNFGELSMFRTAYSPRMLAALKPALKKLPAADRLGLIRDAFALARAGKTKTADALDFLQAYQNEADLVVWEQIAQIFIRLQHLISPAENENLMKLAQKLCLRAYKKLGWERGKNESHTAGILRALILNFMIKAGYEPAVKKALNMFRQSGSNSSNQIPAELRGAVYSAAAAHGGKKEINRLIKMHAAAAMQEEQERIQTALARVRNNQLLKKVLTFAFSKQVREQSQIFMLAGILQNVYVKDEAWKYISPRWQELKKRYPGGRMLSRITAPFWLWANADEYEQLKEFFKKHPIPGARRAEQQALENMEANVLWKARDGREIGEWLRENI